MFRNKYTKDNEKIVPDQALLEHLRTKMYDETGKKRPRARLNFAYIATAIVAVIAIIISTGALYIYTNKTKLKSTEHGGTNASMINSGGHADKITVSEKYDPNQARLKAASYNEVYSIMKNLTFTNGMAVATAENKGLGGVIDRIFNGQNKASPNSKAGSDNGVPQQTIPGKAENNAKVEVQKDEAQSGTNEFSDTNVQVKGVDEADIIKTDGKYIYGLNNEKVSIVKINGKDMKVMSTIRLNVKSKNNLQTACNDMYVSGDKLVLIYNKIDYIEKTVENNKEKEYIGYEEADTYYEIYDIKDREKPKLEKTMIQNGNLVSSRMVGNILYTISKFAVPEVNIKEDKPDSFVPSVKEDGKTQSFKPQDICVVAQPAIAEYVVITSIDVTKPQEGFTDKKSVLGSGDEIYSNAQNMLIASNNYSEKSKKQESSAIVETSYNTNLIRISLKEGTITPAVGKSIPGTLLNQFSMDEHKGYFRVVSHNNSSTVKSEKGIEIYETEESNALYTLDQDLNIVGKLEKIAPGEHVKSVRFDGDTGYFVTFRQVDPLFAVDLSDAKNPKLLSELKIPGFSEYMHPYKDGLLFGFGQDADENTGRVFGLKLSMFDTSDLTNVREKHTEKLHEYSYSEASVNHKAILVSPEKDLITFAADNTYLVFKYDKDKGFSKVSAIMNKDNDPNYFRGLYINDIFYVYSENYLRAFDMSTFNLLSSIKH